MPERGFTIETVQGILLTLEPPFDQWKGEYPELSRHIDALGDIEAQMKNVYEQLAAEREKEHMNGKRVPKLEMSLFPPNPQLSMNGYPLAGNVTDAIAWMDKLEAQQVPRPFRDTNTHSDSFGRPDPHLLQIPHNWFFFKTHALQGGRFEIHSITRDGRLLTEVYDRGLRKGQSVV